jgi:hypothetical protein
MVTSYCRYIPALCPYYRRINQSLPIFETTQIVLQDMLRVITIKEKIGVLEYQAVDAVRLEAVGHMARLTGLTKPTARLP